MRKSKVVIVLFLLMALVSSCAQQPRSTTAPEASKIIRLLLRNRQAMLPKPIRQLKLHQRFQPLKTSQLSTQKGPIFGSTIQIHQVKLP